MTSFDVVRRIRRASGVRRVGHAGILDRPATGVLPVAIGDCTRLIDALVEARKRYRAGVVLGVETDTYDASGAVVRTSDASGVTRESVLGALEPFRGSFLQTPPAYSAVKLDGERAYRAARRGEHPRIEPREVVAYRIELTSFTARDDGTVALTLEIECGKGFYVRSLAHDLGARLGAGGHVSALRRTAVGPFAIEDATDLDTAAALLEAGETDELVHAPDAVLSGWPALVLGQSSVATLHTGHDVQLGVASILRAAAAGTRARAYGPDGKLVALVEFGGAGGAWHPYRVLYS
jgi:tRNA pseudouridine55 synthase